MSRSVFVNPWLLTSILLLLAGCHPPDAVPPVSGPQAVSQPSSGAFWPEVRPGGRMATRYLLDTLANDEITAPTLIPGLPFSSEVVSNILDATTNSNDPISPCVFSPVGTLWYQLAPLAAATEISIDTSNNLTFENVSVFTGEPGNLSLVTCDTNSQGFTRFTAAAGTSYFLMVTFEQGVPSDTFQLNAKVYEPLTIEFKVDPVATLSRDTKEVFVTGSLKTNKPSQFFSSLLLRQKVGHAYILSGSVIFGQPDGTTALPWSATFTGGNYSGGSAQVSLFGSRQIFSIEGDNLNETNGFNGDVTIRLKPTK